MIEDSIKQQVLNQIKDKINLTYKELAWQAEKSSILLEKIKSKYIDVTDSNLIVLYSFDGNFNVSSFKTVSLPKDMEQYKNELEKKYLAKLLEKQKNKENAENQSKFF